MNDANFIIFCNVVFSCVSASSMQETGNPYFEVFYDHKNSKYHSLSSLPRTCMEHFTLRHFDKIERKVHAIYGLYLDSKSYVGPDVNEIFF